MFTELAEMLQRSCELKKKQTYLLAQYTYAQILYIKILIFYEILLAYGTFLDFASYVLIAFFYKCFRQPNTINAR